MTTEQALILLQNKQDSITTEIFSKLDKYEDFLSYYIQLSEASDAVSWIKADLLLHMNNKLGSESIKAMSQELKHPEGTVSSYIRVARAYPTDKRNMALSFSHHYQAMRADQYDEKTKEFVGEKRYEWLEKAQDEKYSTRRLEHEIQKEKDLKNLHITSFVCDLCKKTEGTVVDYVFYPVIKPRDKKIFHFHLECGDQFFKTYDRNI